MTGVYKARLDNPKAIKRIDAIRKQLTKSGVEFTRTMEECWLTIPKHTKYCYWRGDCNNPEHEPKELHSCVVIRAVGTPKYPKPKPVKKAPSPEWKIPADWEWTAEDLVFFEETAKLPSLEAQKEAVA